MVLKSPPTIKTELEVKETGQESESIILRSSKNQTDLVRTPRAAKRPPSTTEVSSTRSKYNMIIRRPAKYTDSPIKPLPTKKLKVKHILIPTSLVGIIRNVLKKDLRQVTNGEVVIFNKNVIFDLRMV